jgi:hypothetical protein
MEVWLAILLAALVGGVVFMLLERWQRSPSRPAVAEHRSEPTAPVWAPEPQTYSSWSPPSHEAETRPLPPPEPRREAPPLWTPPPSRTGHWDDDDRHRDEDDDDRPPGLWSGWANR